MSRVERIGILCLLPGLLVAGAGVWHAPLGTASEPADLSAALGESSTAINVGTRIGEPAPPFTLLDADGRPHRITPGTGRPWVIVFHMGWV